MREAAVVIMVLTGLTNWIAARVRPPPRVDALRLADPSAATTSRKRSSRDVAPRNHLRVRLAAILHHTTDRFIIVTIATMCAASSLLVCIGTKARHPGWLAFGAMAILSFLT
jgi:hypothetical protein